MQLRAQKFRQRQKEEIEQLKRAVQDKCEKSNQDFISFNGDAVGEKRDCPAEFYSSNVESMQEKIQKLEQQIMERDLQLEEIRAR